MVKKSEKCAVVIKDRPLTLESDKRARASSESDELRRVKEESGRSRRSRYRSAALPRTPADASASVHFLHEIKIHFKGRSIER